jgi:hypothetical protein
MSEEQLPLELALIRDEAIRNIYADIPPSDKLSDLARWIEAEGKGEMDIARGVCGLVIDLGYLSCSFYDSELIECEEMESIEAITDKHRTQFVRGQIADAFENGYGDDVCPAVHSCTIRDSNNRTAVMGYLGVQIPGGTDFSYIGIFKDEAGFLAHLQKSNILSDDVVNGLSDDELLSFWKCS